MKARTPYADHIKAGWGQKRLVAAVYAGAKQGEWQKTVNRYKVFHDKQISLGKKETGAHAALTLWIQFIKAAHTGVPEVEFANVVRLETQDAGYEVAQEWMNKNVEADEV